MRQCKHPLINQKFEQIHASSCWVPPFRGWIATVRFLPLIWIGAMSTDSWISDSLRCQLFHPSPQLFEQYDHGLQSYHLRFQCSKTAKAAKQSGNIKQWRPSLQFCNSVVGCSVVVSPSCVTSLSKGLELLHAPFSHYILTLQAHSSLQAKSNRLRWKCAVEHLHNVCERCRAFLHHFILGSEALKQCKFPFWNHLSSDPTHDRVTWLRTVKAAIEESKQNEKVRFWCTSDSSRSVRMIRRPWLL